MRVPQALGWRWPPELQHQILDILNCETLPQFSLRARRFSTIAVLSRERASPLAPFFAMSPIILAARRLASLEGKCRRVGEALSRCCGHNNSDRFHKRQRSNEYRNPKHEKSLQQFTATVVGRRTSCHRPSGDERVRSGRASANRFSGWREIRVLVL